MVTVGFQQVEKPGYKVSDSASWFQRCFFACVDDFEGWVCGARFRYLYLEFGWFHLYPLSQSLALAL
jgi:hypothetical protein